MSDPTYNKETIDSKLNALHETLNSVLEQVQKTNGRVTSLEKWRWTITGIAVAATIIGAGNISLLAKALSGI